MSLAEVAEIIGASPGDYASFTLAPRLRRWATWDFSEHGQRIWLGDEHIFVVMLNEAGTVEQVLFHTVGGPEDSIVDRLRLWQWW
jgi:hypothetical protein